MAKQQPTAFNRIDLEPDFFREAVRATQYATGFGASLIEKDYFCSLILSHLFSMKDCPLVFKGGTALNKVHVGFYRLSEDLDFSIATPFDSTRSRRSKAVALVKDFIARIPKELPGLSFSSTFQGRNNSTQYIGELQYDSLAGSGVSTIKIEAALREPHVTNTEQKPANSLLLDPVSKKPLLGGIVVKVLSKNEAFAEKMRAALARRVPAIRDYFDIDYAIRSGHLRLEDPDFVTMVKAKMAVPGTEKIDQSPPKLAALKTQLATALAPVLRNEDLRLFDLGRAFEQVGNFAKLIG